MCGVKWAPGGRLLSSGCSDGLLTIWPYDPGANAQGPPVKVIHQSTAVKVRNSTVLKGMLGVVVKHGIIWCEG